MEEINRFVMLARSGRFHLTDLCEQFGIGRKTGYKHLERYGELGLAGLQPRSHRLQTSPQRTGAAVEALILAERRRHRTWGLKKRQAVLERKPGLGSPPAGSSMAGGLGALRAGKRGQTLHFALALPRGTSRTGGCRGS